MYDIYMTIYIFMYDFWLQSYTFLYEMPIFLLQDMFVLDKGLMGDSGQHLRLLVRGRDGKTMKLVAFNVPKEWREITKSQRVNLWITLERNEWNGVTSVEGRILKIGLY